MAKLIQSLEFFVVGGPVQAERSCYIDRAADQEILDAVVDARFAYVLAARGSGKSSLMLRTSHTLRGHDQLTAVVDLSQMGIHGEAADASRWFYSVAHRIVRDLRLKVDLQTWWQDRSALAAEHRFADFFSDIVLENTQEPVTILIDEVEQTKELSFAVDFYSVIRNCYALRVSEPDYARLNFVLFGAASALQLCPDTSLSPFQIGDAIVLRDFSLEACNRFEPGFELGTEAAYGLIERIYSWTNGHPYLTQKLARAVARRGGRLEDVERLATELFLGANAVREEPLLSHMRSVLTAPGPPLRPALLLLRRLAKGTPVAADLSSPAQERLRVSGIVAADDDGRLILRNRIYATVFSDKWTRTVMPFNWRGLAAASGVAALLVLVPYWYFTYLPRPYIELLQTPDVQYQPARTAFERMHRLPGFGAQAEELYAQVLADRSREMQSLADVLATDVEIRELQDRSEFADELLAEFWLRRSQQAVDQEDRDAALIYAVNALVGDRQRAWQVVDELTGEDYRRLQATIHLNEPPQLWQADWTAAAVAVVGIDNQGRRMSFGMPPVSAAGIGSPADGQNTATTPPATGAVLTALEHVPLIRELSVDSEGSAGRFELRLIVEHTRAADLTATLTAPSGASVTIVLSETHRSADGFVLDANILADLADERRQGVWRLTLVDGQAGVPGVLHRWSLEFPNATETWLGAPGGIAVPDPERTAEVIVELSANGSLAATRPALVGVSGSLAVWDLSTGQLLHDIRLQQQPQRLMFTGDSRQLLVMAGDELSVWAVATGESTARIRTQTGFVLPPAVSSEGAYVAIAEQVDGAAPLFSLIRTSDGELVASIEGRTNVLDWALGPEARYLVLRENERSLRIMDPRRGIVNTTIELSRPVVRIATLASRDALVTVDDRGEVRIWELLATPEGLVLDSDSLVGNTIDPASLSISADGNTAAFASRPDSVVVHDLSRQRESVLIRAGRAGVPLRTQISADGLSLLSVSGAMLRVWSLADRELMQAPRLDLSALTIDEQGRFAALGFRGGFVRAVSLTALELEAGAAANVDFIGHRGPVTTIALNTEQNLIATGGQDATARIWNLATLSPSDPVLRHADGAVTTLQLSRDGRLLLSAAADTAYLWRVSDGELLNQHAVSGRATTVAFASDNEFIAIGDSTGNVFLLVPEENEIRNTLRADGPVSALAFAPQSDYVVSGDVLGNLLFWPLRENVPERAALKFDQAVRWIEFRVAENALYVQTDQWLHRVELNDEAVVARSSLLPAGLESGAATDDAGKWRLVGSLDLGRLLVTEIIPTAETIVSGNGTIPPGIRRNWNAVLGMRLDAEGTAVPVIR